jgi:hypothetical protein
MLNKKLHNIMLFFNYIKMQVIITNPYLEISKLHWLKHIHEESDPNYIERESIIKSTVTTILGSKNFYDAHNHSDLSNASSDDLDSLIILLFQIANITKGDSYINSYSSAVIGFIQALNFNEKNKICSEYFHLITNPGLTRFDYFGEQYQGFKVPINFISKIKSLESLRVFNAKNGFLLDDIELFPGLRYLVSSDSSLKEQDINMILSETFRLNTFVIDNKEEQEKINFGDLNVIYNDVRVLALNNCGINDQDLKILARNFPNIEALYLFENSSLNTSCDLLSDFPNLHNIFMESSHLERLKAQIMVNENVAEVKKCQRARPSSQRPKFYGLIASNYCNDFFYFILSYIYLTLLALIDICGLYKMDILLKYCINKLPL